MEHTRCSLGKVSSGQCTHQAVSLNFPCACGYPGQSEAPWDPKAVAGTRAWAHTEASTTAVAAAATALSEHGPREGEGLHMQAAWDPL